MKKVCLFALAIAGALFINQSHAATNYAARVVQYNPGVGFSAGFTNVESVLGEPSRVNEFEDLTEPFNPPYGKGKILSIGEGGSLTVKFARPIFDTPRKPFGLDFIIFGNSGFIVTNEFDPATSLWIGILATDGSLFGNNPGVTRVSVSMDGKHFLALTTNSAPTADGLYPTDGMGAFDVPVDPSLTANEFAGATAAGIRALYEGSGGGTGYKVNWARTRNGIPFRLPYIRYVRIEVLSGKTEIDGFSAVARARRHSR